jgi:hypothetical protein
MTIVPADEDHGEVRSRKQLPQFRQRFVELGFGHLRCRIISVPTLVE